MNEALELYNKCLQIEIKNLGEEHTSTANTYNNSALVHLELGNLNMAVEISNKALKILEKN